jgi:DNA topoisomerase-3
LAVGEELKDVSGADQLVNFSFVRRERAFERNGSGNGKNGEQDDETSDPQTLPFVRQGETGVIKPSVEERMTSPPKPYTYHALIGSMNSIHTHVRDAEIRAKLREIQGIGTEATQEAVIATLFERGYIEKKKQNIFSTSLGRHLIDILGVGKGSVLVEPDMTALWEATMTEIEAGNGRLDDFVSDVAGMTREIISDPLRLPPDITGLPRKKRCLTDACGGYLNHVQREGKRPFFSCPLCRKTFNDVSGEPVPRKEYAEPVIEAPCPLRCGRDARRYKSEYGYYWRCSCSPDETFRDSDGKPAAPVERARASCPVRG